MEAGPAEARNAGALAAGGDVLVFVESTCFPTATVRPQLVLDPSIKRTHLKSSTVLDPWRPGVPWVVLLMRRRRAPRELNLGRRHRLSTAAWVAGASAIAIRRPRIAAGSLAAPVVLDRSLYALLWRRGARARRPPASGSSRSTT